MGSDELIIGNHMLERRVVMLNLRAMELIKALA